MLESLSVEARGGSNLGVSVANRSVLYFSKSYDIELMLEVVHYFIEKSRKSATFQNPMV